MAFAARPALLADPALAGAPLCRALAHATDSWLAGVFADSGAVELGPVALVAVGGYGRGELAPASDLDVLLLHDTKRGIEKVAERIWYPVWDARLKLGHSVRTVKEALRLAADDLDTATSLLDIRHVAGDAALTRRLHDDARAQWRKRGRSWLTELARRVDEQHARYGEVAFLLEPNLKEGRGGLRDVHALGWAQAAEMVLLAGDREHLERSYDVLLGARVELHRITGRAGDVLTLEDQDAVAARLGHVDADELMSAVSAAARTIAWTSDEAWQRVTATLQGPSGKAARRDRPVATGVVLRDGEVHLDSSANPASDPTLLLRVAAAAAHHDTRIQRGTLDRLAEECPAFGDPWPAGASDDLVALLLAGHTAIPVLESLDQRGLLVRILPEWGPCGASRSATRTTASRWTGTCGRPPPTPPRSPHASGGPTCWCWARCSTTSARAGRATTPTTASTSCAASARAWGSPARTWRCWRRWCATTSSSPTWPPGGT
jgi:[protein-PII] uridylyltransferase